MVDYAYVQGKIDYGLGKAGAVLGQPFSAYRAAGGSGDYPTGWTSVGSSVPVYRVRVSDSKLQAAMKASGTIWYEINGGMQAFLLGDVFASADAPFVSGQSYGAGATFLPGSLQFDGFALAWHGPGFVPIGARVDRRCRIYRPSSAPQMLTTGNVAWRQTSDDSMPLVLTAGVFAFGSPGGTASYVPFGIGSTERPPTGRNFTPATPGIPGVPRYYGYLPPLPGYQPTEGDRIETEDGARYDIINPYDQQAGVVGSQLLLDRVISQTA